MLRGDVAMHEALPIIFDTDIGSDIDDAYALAMILSSHELSLEAVTVVSGDIPARARIAAKMLALAGRDDVPLAHGVPNPKDVNQAPWAEGFAYEPDPRSAPELIVEMVSARPGEITLVPVGPMSNIAAALELRPELADEVAEIVIMGGGVWTGYRSHLHPVPEYNIKVDVPAAQALFESGAPIRMAGLEATAALQFDRFLQERLAQAGVPLAQAMTELLTHWPSRTPTLYDPMAVAMVIEPGICDYEPACVAVEKDGLTVECDGEPNCLVAVRPRIARFFELLMAKLTAGAV
ncbi:MAG: nucleoside hydrolase [candidate division WS1 bacterium]|jgi:inosine-uridine nucleoside N-ribohydrolase|nr:nucleoside hydrolase [candidate division WS1 bacterium]